MVMEQETTIIMGHAITTTTPMPCFVKVDITWKIQWQEDHSSVEVSGDNVLGQGGSNVNQWQGPMMALVSAVLIEEVSGLFSKVSQHLLGKYNCFRFKRSRSVLCFNKINK